MHIMLQNKQKEKHEKIHKPEKTHWLPSVYWCILCRICKC